MSSGLPYRSQGSTSRKVQEIKSEYIVFALDGSMSGLVMIIGVEGFVLALCTVHCVLKHGMKLGYLCGSYLL